MNRPGGRRSFFPCERGAALVEYALLIGAVALSLSTVAGMMGDEINNTLQSLLSHLRGGNAAP